MACGNEERAPAVASFNALGGAPTVMLNPDAMGGSGAAGSDPDGGDPDVDTNPGFGGAVSVDVPTVSRGCELEREWGDGVAIDELNGGGTVETLLEVTPDERSLVFLRDGAPYLSERESPDDDFSEPSALVLSGDYDPSLGLALSPDGLSMVVTMAGSVGFALWERNSRSDDFVGAPDSNSFLLINSLYPMAGVGLSHPAFSGSGAELWWVETREVSSVWKSDFDSNEMDLGSEVGCSDLGCDALLHGTESTPTLLSGLSSDGLSVFVSLPGADSEVRQRPNLEASFVFEESLGERESPQPNADCSRLYFSADGELYFSVPD